jgi:hypothetical protein
MKRTKRLLALVLAMMMAFAMLAMPAAAHGDEDEGIMPLGQTRTCLQCKVGAVSSYFATEIEEVYPTCGNCNYPHLHVRTYRVAREACNSCSYDVKLQNPAPVLLRDDCRHPYVR